MRIWTLPCRKVLLQRESQRTDIALWSAVEEELMSVDNQQQRRVRRRRRKWLLPQRVFYIITQKRSFSRR